MLEILKSFSDEEFLSNLPGQMGPIVKSLQMSGVSIDELKIEAKITINVIISVVSGYVGKEIGVSAAVCVPFVVLSIIAILRATTEAIFNSYN
ncbi:hypothetical protein [uncultured Clostridium sp.]|uniref:hypothetical protein n=1 Tax=uncultured Clostridium sp. TaxID=59620 RepID=UPI0025F5A137|nr:hypothetical protein [uncultured Clostridium sp.]